VFQTNNPDKYPTAARTAPGLFSNHSGTVHTVDNLSPRHRSRTHNTYTRLTALCPGLPRWAGTRKVKPICTFLEQETVSSSGISWAVCKSAPRSSQITTPATHHSVFYRPDALSAAQPTVSKHWWANNPEKYPTPARTAPGLFSNHSGTVHTVDNLSPRQRSRRDKKYHNNVRQRTSISILVVVSARLIAD